MKLEDFTSKGKQIKDKENIKRKREIEKSLVSALKVIITLFPEDIQKKFEETYKNEKVALDDLFITFKRLEDDKKIDWSMEDTFTFFESILSFMSNHSQIRKLYLQRNKIIATMEKIAEETVAKEIINISKMTEVIS